MDTFPPSSERKLSIGDLHRAVELMAIDQSILSFAVVHLLKRLQSSEPEDEGLQTLIKSIDRSVDKLSELSQRLMDFPHEY